MFCKYCGKQIEDDSRFCKYCGKDVSEIVSHSTNNVEDKRPQHNQIKNKTEIKKTVANPKGKGPKKISARSVLLAVFCIVIALLGICFLVTYYHGETMQDELAAEECIIEDPNYINNEHISIPKGECYYTGHVNENRLPDGEGIACFDNGDVFEGKFVNGNFSEGRYTWISGLCFEGSFEDNSPYSGPLTYDGALLGIYTAKQYVDYDKIMEE